MKIKTFPVEEYRGCPIYYRNFKDHFEYLTILNGELYTAHIRVRPYWITQMICLFDIFTKVGKTPYSEQHLKNILFTLHKMAETTIDFILDKNIISPLCK